MLLETGDKCGMYVSHGTSAFSLAAHTGLYIFSSFLPSLEFSKSV